MSQGMQFLPLGWLVWRVTGYETQIGLTLFFYGIPNGALLIVGGIIAGRINRKLLLMVSQTLVGMMIAGPAKLTITESVALWHIYLARCCRALCRHWIVRTGGDAFRLG